MLVVAFGVARLRAHCEVADFTRCGPASVAAFIFVSAPVQREATLVEATEQLEAQALALEAACRALEAENSSMEAVMKLRMGDIALAAPVQASSTVAASCSALLPSPAFSVWKCNAVRAQEVNSMVTQCGTGAPGADALVCHNLAMQYMTALTDRRGLSRCIAFSVAWSRAQLSKCLTSAFVREVSCTVDPCSAEAEVTAETLRRRPRFRTSGRQPRRSWLVS